LPRRRRSSKTSTSTTRSQAKRTTSSASKTSKRTTRRRKKTINVEKYVRSIVKEVASRLGLDLLGLKDEEYYDVLGPAIEMVLGEATYKPKVEQIVSRLKRYYENVAELIASNLLRIRESFTPEQLEFIIAYGRRVAAGHVQKLYREALRLGREDLIAQLKYVWHEYGKPTPIPCPKCGFRAVLPDLTCFVCGAVLSEKDVRKAVDFNELFKEFVETSSISDLRETLERGYVLLGEYIKPPIAQREPWDIEIFLSKDEKEYIRKKIMEKSLRNIHGEGK